MKKSIITLGLMLAFVTPQAIAQDVEKKRSMRAGPAILQHLDTNKDGNITRDEVDAARMERFKKIDTNGDQMLSEAEMTAAREARREEMKAKAEERRAKMEAKREKRREKRAEKRKERSMERREARMETIDENGDGMISLDEFDNQELKLFDKLDADGDGTITEAERKAMGKKMRKRMKKRDKRGNR